MYSLFNLINSWKKVNLFKFNNLSMFTEKSAKILVLQCTEKNEGLNTNI